MAPAVRPSGRHRRRASAAARAGTALVGAAVLAATGYGAYSLAAPLSAHPSAHRVVTSTFGQSLGAGEELAGRATARPPAALHRPGPAAPSRPPLSPVPPVPPVSAVPSSAAPTPSASTASPAPAVPTAPSAPAAPASSGAPGAGAPPAPSAPATAPPGPAAPAYVLPVAGGVVSTPYGATGSVWASGRNHGCDFPVPTGTPVRAVGAGTVARAGWDGAYGTDVLVRMDDGMYTLYAHLDSAGVSAGDPVTAGQVIGRSGASGKVTGAHLHFEVRTTPAYGSDTDPVAYLREHGALR